ncbi:MAG: thiamine phosphate synthase [Candidatus Eremiobacteraeota bacterium]|nr:thiamine phosphate synthase [Candidatus Eremiobacteraeota bacterium]
MKMQKLQGIYAIVSGCADVVPYTSALLEGGIRIVQYRAKGTADIEALQALRELTAARDALFIVNDDWQAALSVDADGAHLGPDDATRAQLPMIREYLHDRLLGLSCGTVEEAQYAESLGADYIGVGSVFATSSKRDAGTPIGIAGLREVAAATQLPAAAIGGITHENIAAVRATGVAMAAVISALTASADPREVAAALVRAWEPL